MSSNIWDGLDDSKQIFPDIETTIRFRGGRAFQDACRDNDLAAVTRCLEESERGRLDLGPRELGDGFLAACYSGHIVIVSHLVSIAKSINLDANIQDSLNGRTGFNAACSQCPLSIVSLLISSAVELRIDVNLPDNSGRTGFIAACIRGDSSIISELVMNAAEIGLEANLQDNEGMTGLMGACAYDRASVVAILVLNAEAINLDVSLMDKTGETPFEHCVKYNRFKPLIELAPLVDTSLVRASLGDVTAAAYCVENQLVDTLAALGMHGSRQFRACSDSDRSALSIAYDRGDALSIRIMTEARRNRHVEAVRTLFDAVDAADMLARLDGDQEFVSGIDWVVLGHTGDTLIHHFCAVGDDTIRDLLWQKVGSIDTFLSLKDARGSNVLLSAFLRKDIATVEWLSNRTERDFFETARVINATLRDTNKNKVNCFDVACEDPVLWRLMMKRFVAAAAAIEKLSPKIVANLVVRSLRAGNLDSIRFISDPWREIKIDWTVVVPVMFAPETPTELFNEAIAAFLRYLPTNKDEQTGMTVMHRACERGCLELVRSFDHLKNVNVANQNGETPVYAAAKNGHLNAVNELIRMADSPTLTVTKPNSNGPASVSAFHEFNETPLEVAASSGYEEVAKVLHACQLGRTTSDILIDIVSEDTKSDEIDGSDIISCRACGMGNLYTRSTCQACFLPLEMDDSKKTTSDGIDRVAQCLREWRENGKEMLAFIQDPFPWVFNRMDDVPPIWLFTRDPATGDTALHVACRSDRPDAPAAIRVLLENGARLSCTNQVGESPLLVTIRLTRVDSATFLLTQRLSEFVRRDLDMCLDEAQRIGVIDDLLRRIRLRAGAKYSDDMPVKVQRLNTCRSVAKKMSEFMLEEEVKDIWRVKKDRCNSLLFQALKSTLIRAFERHEPFSDDNLMAVLVHARDHHEDEFKTLMAMISDKEDFCLVEGNKARMAFIWFETFLSCSAIYHEGDSRAKLVAKIELLSGWKNLSTSTPQDADLDRYQEPSDSSQFYHLSADETAEICECVSEHAIEWGANERVARQDCIPHAIAITDDPLVQKIVAKSPSCDFDDLMKKCNEDNVFLHDYDTDVYLDRLLLTATVMKSEFDDTMVKIECKMKSSLGVGEESDALFLKCVPVKVGKRTKEKVGKRYNDVKTYPKSAQILDIMRCSFTFANVPLMLDGMRLFLDTVAEGKREFDNTAGTSTSTTSGLIGVPRIENMFAEGRNDHYRDIKLNVVFYSSKFGKSMIAEVQFILHDFLIGKKSENRSIQSIVREQEIFEIGHATATEDYFAWKLVNAARLRDSKAAGMAMLLGADPEKVTDELDRELISRVAPMWNTKDDMRRNTVIPAPFWFILS